MKSPSSTVSSVKLKTLVHTLISSRVCRVARALSKTKSILIELLREIQLTHYIHPLRKNKKRTFGSFRLQYNSSHVYYDSTRNSIFSSECDDRAESQLSGYLHWLEENVGDNSKTENKNEIDRLADVFIANCHEKFMLEKQESYRSFQEMMARSV